MRAPNFSLADQNGTLHSLDEHSGRWLVLYFYPKDDTPGCTKEACGFRDVWERYATKGIAVMGISKDSVSSHKKFSEKFALHFPLLSDSTTEVMRAYGAWGLKKFMGKTFEGTLRKTYLINPTGEIVKEYDQVDPGVHASQILADFDGMHTVQ